MWAKSLVKGVGSAVTFPADVGIGVTNWIKRELGYPQDTLDTNASDVMEKGLQKAGFPASNNSTQDSALDIAGQGVGGVLSGGLLGSSKSAPALTAENYHSLPGVTNSANQKVLGSLVASKLGLNANTRLTTDALNAAHTQATSFMDAVRPAGTTIMQDPSETAGAIAVATRKFTPSDGRLMEHPAVKSLIDTLSNGTADGADLGAEASNLGKAGTKAFGEDPNMGRGLFALQDHVEGILKDAVTPEVAQSYQDALSRYGLIKHLMEPGSVNRATGEINTSALAKYFGDTDPKGYALGQNNSPLYQVLRQSEGMGGNPLDATAGYHTKLFAVARAAASTIPGAANNVVQLGLKPALRQLVNKPGFVTALGNELQGGNDNGTNNIPNGPSSNP
jgi:hypothetical protein